MRRIVLTCAVLVSAACGGAATHEGTTPVRVQRSELETFAREMMTHVERGEFAALEETACPEAVVYDIGDQGQPIVARGRAEVNRYLDAIQHAIQSSDMHVETHTTQIECRPMTESGVCYIEFDQTATGGGHTMGPYHLRGTLVLERVNGRRWIWAHWHGSYAQLPPEMTQCSGGAGGQTPPTPPADGTSGADGAPE